VRGALRGHLRPLRGQGIRRRRWRRRGEVRGGTASCQQVFAEEAVEQTVFNCGH